MMNIKNRNGFTILETIVALAVAAIIFMPLLSLLNSVISSVGTESERIQKMLYAKEFLMQSRIQAKQQRQFKAEEINEQNDTLTYERSPIQNTSALGKITHLVKEEVTISWQSRVRQKSDSLVTYLFVPEQKEQNE